MNMLELWGIILQLGAGIIFGLPYLLSQSFFQRIDDGLRKGLDIVVSKGRFMLVFILFVAVMTPFAYLVWAVFQTELSEYAWYDKIFMILYYGAPASFVFVAVLKRSMAVMVKNKNKRFVPSNIYYQVIVLSLTIFILCAILITLSVNGVRNLAQVVLYETGVKQIALFVALRIIVYVVIGASLIWFGSGILLLLSSIAKYASLAASQVRKPIWVGALLCYVVGGGLLIANVLLK